MSLNETQISYILDQLELVEGVIHRKMFGGVGFFKEGKMFGMLNSKGTLLLKVDSSNIQDYLDCQMPAFSHGKNKKGSMPYYEVPLDVVENRRKLKQWADKSINIALHSK